MFEKEPEFASNADLSIAQIQEKILSHLKQIRESDFFIAIITKKYLKLNVQIALEFGTALIAGKKIGLLIQKDTEISEKMILLSDDHEFFDGPADIKVKGDLLYNRMCEKL